MTRRFQRLATVPGVSYIGGSEVNQKNLSGNASEPPVPVGTYEGKREESLSRTTRDGSTSASPTQQRNAKPPKNESPAEGAWRQLQERLELPGTLSDYHFAIQSCQEELWKLRREEPWVLVRIEELCWLNIRLIEAYPATIAYQTTDGKQLYARVSAFYRLIYLYEREGFLHEALDVAQRAVRLGNAGNAVERLQGRLAELATEGEG